MKKLLLILICTATSLGAKKQRLSLADQELFRQWVHGLSLNFFVSKKINSLEKNRRWSVKNQDCSGFIRYLWWEAFSHHDGRWHLNFGSHLTRSLPNIQAKRPAMFSKGRKVNFVNAYNLWRYNSRFLSRDFHNTQLKEADLLFFQLENGDYHTMFLIKDSRSQDLMAIYHTGDKNTGLRLVKFVDLFEHSQSRWHPTPTNKSFLGFYRLYFLD